MIQFSIIDEADQQFGVVLNGQRVTMRLRYNGTSDRWSFDLSVDDLPVLYGRRIVTGVDLLLPFDFGLGIIFALPVSPDDMVEPGRRELVDGTVGFYHTTAEEVESLLA